MSKPVTWAIYLRISRTDDRLGVERQLADCQAQLELMGADPQRIELFDENNTSATKGLANRPEYLRMVAEAEAGRIGGVMVWAQDRAWRDTDELSAFLKLRTRFATSSTGEANLSDPDTLAAIKIAGVNAEREVAVAGRRVAKASKQRAEAGKAHGRAPFGWSREVTLSRGRIVDSWDEIEEAEAGLIRHAAARLIAGASLRSIVGELNAGEVKPRAYTFGKGRHAGTDSARVWTGSQLKALLLRPSNAGLRVYKGEVLAGVTTEAPAILDLATYTRIKVILADPARRANGRGSAPRWLLSGIATCSVCPDGGKINVVTGGTRPGRKAAYTCVGKPGAKGCFQRHWVEDLDSYVGALVEGRLADPVLGEAGPEVQLELDALYAQIDAQRSEQSELGALVVAKAITRQQLVVMNAGIETEIAELEARIDRLQPQLGPVAVLDEWRQAVKAQDITTQRAIVRQVFESIELVPSVHAGRVRTADTIADEVRETFRGAR